MDSDNIHLREFWMGARGKGGPDLTSDWVETADEKLFHLHRAGRS